MIVSKRLGLKAVKASWIATCMISSLMSCCSIAYCQTDPKSVPLKQERKGTNDFSLSIALRGWLAGPEKKLWHETAGKWNSLVKEQKWQEIEKLANETASKLGFEDDLIQGMLWTSINGQRKSQGLPTLIKQTRAQYEKPSIVKYHSLNELVPIADYESTLYVDVLTQCLSAAIESGETENSETKIVYDAENKRLKVVASKPQQQLVDAILKRMSESNRN